MNNELTNIMTSHVHLYESWKKHCRGDFTEEKNFTTIKSCIAMTTIHTHIHAETYSTQ